MKKIICFLFIFVFISGCTVSDYKLNNDSNLTSESISKSSYEIINSISQELNNEEVLTGGVIIEQIGAASLERLFTYEDNDVSLDKCDKGNLIKGFAYCGHIEILVNNVSFKILQVQEDNKFNGCVNVYEGNNVIVTVLCLNNNEEVIGSDFWNIKVYANESFVRINNYEKSCASGILIEGSASNDVDSVDIYVGEVYLETIFFLPNGGRYFKKCITISQSTLVEVKSYNMFRELLDSDMKTIG